MTHPDPSLATTLAGARVLAHHAAAIPSELGVTWLPHDEGFRFSNLGWDERRGALVGQDVQGLAAGLRMADLTWQVWRGDELVGEKAAEGSTLAEGRAWLRALAVEHGLEDRPIESSSWDMPEHPVAQGRAFPAPPAELTQLAAWFSLAAGALAEVAGARGEVRSSAGRRWHVEHGWLVRGDAPGERYGPRRPARVRPDLPAQRDAGMLAAVVRALTARPTVLDVARRAFH